MSEVASARIRVRRPVAVLLLVQLFNGIVVAAQGTFFPIYATEALGLTAAIVSSFASLARGAGMVAAVLGGSLIDVLGRKSTLLLGLGCFILSGTAFLADSSWLIAALWAVNGLALGLESLGAQSYLIAAAGTTRLGVISAFYNFGFTVGGALSSPFAGYVLDARGYGSFARLLVGLSAFTTVLAYALMPRLNSGDSDRRRKSWRNVLAGYRETLRRPAVVRLGLVRFLPTCYYGMSLVLIPLLIHAETGTKTSVAVYVTINQILATAAQLVAGRAADRMDPHLPTLVAACGVMAASLGLTLFAGHVWGLFCFGTLGAASAWSLSTLMPVLVSRAVPSEVHGRVLGTLNLLWHLAMILSGLVGGALLSAGTGVPFLVATILNAGAVFVVLAMRHSERGFVAVY